LSEEHEAGHVPGAMLIPPANRKSGRCGMETEKEKEEKAILAKLALLAKMRQLHEWTVFGRKEAEDEEKAEMEIDSEASDSTTDQRKGGHRARRKDIE